MVKGSQLFQLGTLLLINTSFDGGSTSIMNSDIFAVTEVKEKKDTLEQILSCNPLVTKPLSIYVVRRELRQTISGVGKSTLREFFIRYWQNITTVDYVCGKVLSTLSDSSTGPALDGACTSTFKRKCNFLQDSLLSGLSKTVSVHKKKLTALCMLCNSILYTAEAPPWLKTIEQIKQLTFWLLLDFRLWTLYLLGYDLISTPTCPMRFNGTDSQTNIYCVEDPSHVLKRICVHASKLPFCGSNPEDWLLVARTNATSFKEIWYERDIQNVPITLNFISQECENKLRDMGKDASASLCYHARMLWECWDSKQIELEQKLELMKKVKSYFYTRFLRFYYGDASATAEEFLEAFPHGLSVAICTLIDSFFRISSVMSMVHIPWQPRSASTNDVENFFSRLKYIVGRDGRGVRLVSAQEMAFGLRKTCVVFHLLVSQHRNFIIPDSKKRSYLDYAQEDYIPRHVSEKRYVQQTAVTRAAKGTIQNGSIRSFFSLNR